MKKIMRDLIGHFMRQVVDNLPLVEDFYSFQGEGKFAGTPSIFIRLGGCNLNCKGFGVQIDGIIGCDSIKAVHKDRYSHEWRYIDDLKPIINSHLIDLEFKPDIVFTGGEPLTHHENPILLEALEHYISKGYKVTFETNATIEIDFKKYPVYKDVVFAMSVKLENSGEDEKKRIKKESIKAICENTKNSFFKFVLSKKDRDNSEIRQIISYFKDIPVYCMPMGSTSRELAKNDKWVANFCIKFGYNYVDRMHIRLWDNEEGR
jgi:6-pyruvoyltetrahydropterin 2'-reductase